MLLQWCGAEGVESETFASVDHGEFSCQGQDGAFACCVGQLGCGGTDEPDDTGGVDDAGLCLSVLAEAQDRVLAAEPHTLDVDGLCQIPDLLWCVDGI